MRHPKPSSSNKFNNFNKFDDLNNINNFIKFNNFKIRRYSNEGDLEIEF